MDTHGLPNDIVLNLNPISVLIVLPVLDKLVYPLMNRIGIRTTATIRMTIGFMFVSTSMAIAAGVQQVIYTRLQCHNGTSRCAMSEKSARPSDVTVALQIPIYVAGAIGEVFFSVAGSEYAYNQAPAGMKSILQAVYMSTLALSSALGLAVSPAFRDPYMTIVYAALSGSMFLCSLGFAFCFWRVG